MRLVRAFLGRSVLAVLVGMVAAFGAASVARANVYAAHLAAPDGWNFDTTGPLTLTYRLNEPATIVTIEIFRAATPGTVVKTISGTTAYGLNSVLWDGTVDGGGPVPPANDYAFRVIAEDLEGHEAWTNITPKVGVNEIGSGQYAAPQGIAVNRDLNSELFGRVYVLNAESGVTSFNPGATAVGDGIFMLNNDMTFFRGTAAQAAAPANVALETDAFSIQSPWRLHINPDNSDELVVGDLSTGFENVWLFNGEGTVATRLLDRTTTGPGTGAAQNHGNAFDVMITRTGSNRRLWIIDQDYDLHGDIQLTGPDISMFFLGTATEDYIYQPWEVVNGGELVPGAAGRNYTARGFYLGKPSRHLYVANQRFNPGSAELALTRYLIDAFGEATSAVWSLSNDDITADPVVSSALGIAWNQTYVVAVDEPRGVGAAGRTGGGQIIIFDPADGSILAAFDGGGDQIRDMDFDAAGNLLTTNVTDQHARMWSPSVGTNGFTTGYVGVMNIGPDASPDCNDNNVPDETDIAVGTSEDCNSNAVPDECDIGSGQSFDADGNGIPDECDVAPPVIFAAPAAGDTLVTVTAIEPDATLVVVLVDGTTNGTASPGGEMTVDVPVSALSMGQVVTAKTIADGFESVLSDPEIVTTDTFTTTLICDDFEYADQTAFDAVWTAEAGNQQLILSDLENTTLGGAKSVQALNTDLYRSKLSGLTGIVPTSTHPLVWTVDIYDETADTDVDQWADLIVDPGSDFFLAEIGIASPFFTGVGEPETHYQARIIGNGGPDWFHLDQFQGPTRSVGWHRFAMVFKGHRSGETQGHYVDLYVDGWLAAKNVHVFEDTTLEIPRIGSGQESAAGASFDEYCATVGPVSDLTLPLDCNTNLVEDFIDIDVGTSLDVNSNDVPDECEPDCNTNGLPDSYDLDVGLSLDCNANAIPDACDMKSGFAQDCNFNGAPDSCDLAFGDSADCNTNGIPDACDIAVEASPDCDGNGRPDECDLHPGGQVAKLLSSDANTFQRFGYSLAIDGDYAVVGVPRSGVGGAVYVLRRVGIAWVEQQRIFASDGEESDRFGQAVAIQGNRIMVGADGDADAGTSTGAAYVFERTGGIWSQKAKLTASNGAAGDQFGFSVGLSGDYALIGSYLADGAGGFTGSVYAFVHSNGAWVETQELNPADAASADLFGWSMAVDDDYAVIGAIRDDDGGSDSGSAYVYVNNSGTWVEQVKLTADDAASGDLFGFSIAISGPLVVVGAFGEDGPGLFDSGSAYAFVNTNGTWVQEAKLIGDDTASFDAFAASVALSGDLALIGARGTDDAGGSSGSAYLFRRNGGNWRQEAKLTAADAAAGDQFGGTVAMGSNDVLVAAQGDDDAGSFSGSVYGFRLAVFDCNENQTLDQCEDLADCNDNATPDVCETIGPGDFDADGDVDLTDLEYLLECLTGPGGSPAPPPPLCASACLDAFDSDADTDVDLWDVAGFQTVFTGY